ncbi:unnamed protein product [Angiostrongylus costaricensis]|uniref:C-type lectin domain-containing protein n=1 Tax=Angiostrongylus costaricensis TaxID=334426 RepID=A0A158PDU6_ANGCS|nr:unnamed protein product [Angiostrongylus costaricensis]
MVRGNLGLKIHNAQDNSWRMQWTQGEQPWCRHRAKDNILVWLQWMSIVMAILLVLIGIFAICWFIKQSDRKKRRSPSRSASVVGPETEFFALHMSSFLKRHSLEMNASTTTILVAAGCNSMACDVSWPDGTDIHANWYQCNESSILLFNATTFDAYAKCQASGKDIDSGLNKMIEFREPSVLPKHQI